MTQYWVGSSKIGKVSWKVRDQDFRGRQSKMFTCKGRKSARLRRRFKASKERTGRDCAKGSLDSLKDKSEARQMAAGALLDLLN